MNLITFFKGTKIGFSSQLVAKKSSATSTTPYNVHVKNLYDNTACTLSAAS